MAIVMGVAASRLRGTIYDPILMILALIGVSTPVFWLGQVIDLDHAEKDGFRGSVLSAGCRRSGYNRSPRTRCCGLRA